MIPSDPPIWMLEAMKAVTSFLTSESQLTVALPSPPATLASPDSIQTVIAKHKEGTTLPSRQIATTPEPVSPVFDDSMEVDEDVHAHSSFSSSSSSSVCHSSSSSINTFSSLWYLHHAFALLTHFLNHLLLRDSSAIHPRAKSPSSSSFSSSSSSFLTFALGDSSSSMAALSEVLLVHVCRALSIYTSQLREQMAVLVKKKLGLLIC
jgi:hypothetical protein